MHQQTCAQFDSKGKHCRNPSEIHKAGIENSIPSDVGWSMDFCAMHNHMMKSGISLKCWRCGDKEPI